MAHIPVSIGIPSLVMRKRSHVVNMVDEGRIEFVRRIPYGVVFLSLLIANLAYVGSEPFAGLGNPRGFGIIADGAMLVLAVAFLMIGRRVRVDREQMAEANIVFLPEWTYMMLLGVLVGVVILLT